MKFFNHFNQSYTDDAVEYLWNGWYIKTGFAGCNTNENNSFGYPTKEKAEEAILAYQGKGSK